jgi:cyclic pyranopterin phosphate synthase
MIDALGRNINKLRVSVTDACNFSCIYCVDKVGGHYVSKNQLSCEEHLHLIGMLKQHAGIEKIRITGGEPLLFAQLPTLIRGLTDMGFEDISVTTNAYLLERKVDALREAGLTALNISLDSVDPDNFERLARGGNLRKVLRGIEKAVELKIPTKVNMVVMRGENDHELVDMLDFALERHLELRFLELMKMGPLYKHPTNGQTAPPDRFVSMAEMLSAIREKYTFTDSDAPADSTAVRYRVPGGVFGIIANESAPFCAGCSRLRLTSTGKLIGCLSNPQEVSIRELLESPDAEQLREKVRESIAQKRTDFFTGSSAIMSSMGG